MNWNWDWVNRKNVATAIVSGVILAIGGEHISHRAEADDDRDLLEQSVATQETMAQAVEVLIDRAKVEDARKDLMAELCRAGKLKDDDCSPFDLTD